jgi:hypothetical protein
MKVPVDYEREYGKCKEMVKFYVVAFIVLTVLLFLTVVARADEVFTNDQIANAIFKAENSKTHPYGILTHYKVTTPRQACLNTISHARRDWDGKGDFIVFLGSRYCPVNAHPLNRNWVKNVHYFLQEEL